MVRNLCSCGLNMNRTKKVYTTDPSKFGTCPKCGHKNGLNPFRFGGLTKVTDTLSGHKVVHHKCKKCLWQGYVLVNSESRVVNYTTHFLFYAFWGLVGLSIPLAFVYFLY